MKALRALGLAIVIAMVGGSSACGVRDREDSGSSSDKMSPVDRFLAGRGSYVADPSLAKSLAAMERSESERRARAWAVAERVLAPVAIDGGSVPRFQTWYSREEIQPIFGRVLSNMSKADIAAHKPPTHAQVDEAFEWEAKRITATPGWERQVEPRRAEFQDGGAANLGGPERVLMSPEALGHMFLNYGAMLDCMNGRFPGANDPPPSDTNFAPCVGTEFPAGAAIVKARWIPEFLPLASFDTSAEGLARTLTLGEWTTERTASPGPELIYTMRTPTGIKQRLAAVHIMTKELRDWIWITLFWSETPTADFGEDRPPGITGPMASLKMCVVVGYDEQAPAPSSDTSSLGRALATTRSFGPRTWCSNPYLEEGPHAATTSCIGCHQHAGTDLGMTAILETFPDGSRAKLRRNFPADYTFVTTSVGNIDATNLMKSKVDQALGD